MKKARTLFFVHIGLAILIAIGFAVFIMVYSTQDMNNLFLLGSILAGYVVLAFYFSFAISYFYGLYKDARGRRDEIMKSYNADVEVASRQQFQEETGKRAIRNNLIMFNRRKIQKDHDALLEKARQEGKDIPDIQLKGKLLKAPYGAYIAISLFSTNENYQYFQTEQMHNFYGHVMVYFAELRKQPDYKKTLKVGFQDNTFFVYYEGESLDDIDAFIKKLESDFYTVFEKTGIRLNMHPSFGIYLLGEKTTDVYDMVQNAVLSLHAAMSNFQSYVYYDDRIVEAETHNDKLEQEIRKGIENHDFKVFYQGKFDLASQKFVGAEALIRWQRNGVGAPISPGAFIGEAEKSGLVHVLDYYVFEQVCRDLGDWKRRGRRMIPVSVNFSASDLYRPDFVNSIVHEININGIMPNYLEVELTETSTANNFLYVMDILQKLNEENIRILMDDFGTGFSSLGNLAKYPISALKIDKSFVDNMTTDIKNREIVRTIINLARALGMESIAEGVDNDEQVSLLKEMKCNVIQGYYFAKPMSKKDFELYLTTNKFEKKGILL